MLLIFFLVTTSMDSDKGLMRRLPPPPTRIEMERAKMNVKERNVMKIRVNDKNQLICGKDYIALSELKDRVKNFVANTQNSPDFPEKHLKNIDLLGRCMVTDKHIISVQCDRNTSYNAYFEVQNEIVRAYNELRNELAMARFGKAFSQCSASQQDAVRAYYPQNISEAEPNDNGGTKQ